jgi:hypothetical protein
VRQALAAPSLPAPPVEATFTGQLRLFWQTSVLVAGALGVPAALAAAVGVGLVLRRRPPFAAALMLAGVSFYVTYLSVLRAVAPRTVLPLLLVMVPFAGRTLAALWATRHPAARGVAVAVAAYTLAYGGSMDLELLFDARYAAEDWIASHVPAGAAIGSDASAAGGLRLPPGSPRVAVQVSAGGVEYEGKHAPDWLVLSGVRYRRYRHLEERGPGTRVGEGDPRDSYEAVATFGRRYFLGPELVPDVSPTIVILRRQDPDDARAISGRAARAQPIRIAGLGAAAGASLASAGTSARAGVAPVRAVRS